MQFSSARKEAVNTNQKRRSGVGTLLHYYFDTRRNDSLFQLICCYRKIIPSAVNVAIITPFHYLIKAFQHPIYDLDQDENRNQIEAVFLTRLFKTYSLISSIDLYLGDLCLGLSPIVRKRSTYFGYFSFFQNQWTQEGFQCFITSLSKPEDLLRYITYLTYSLLLMRQSPWEFSFTYC